MRAEIPTGLNDDLEVRDHVELEGPGPDELRVRRVASGVRHSFMSFQNATARFRYEARSAERARAR